MKKPIAITAGEPAGIGYDILVTAAQRLRQGAPWLVFADPQVLQQRAEMLRVPLTVQLFSEMSSIISESCVLTVWPTPCAEPVIPGQLNVKNVAAVMKGLSTAAHFCLENKTAALLTLPVHKGIINQSGLPFTGHTEFLAAMASVPKVVMMLAAHDCRVALVTTHLPLNQVAQSITPGAIRDTINIVIAHCQRFYGCEKPTIFVTGLNPHAGEEGHLGKEEQEIIEPVLESLRREGVAEIIGPLPADTLFQKKYLDQADVVVAMYHDQGLAPLKALHFGDLVNITCGLPFIRTSVDHGVALDIAATGKVNQQSFLAALAITEKMKTHCFSAS